MPKDKISQEEKRAKHAKYMREYYHKNREKALALVNKYRNANKEKIKAQVRKFKAENPETVKKWKRDDYEKGRDGYLARAKAHHAANREHHARLMHNWYVANSDKVKKDVREWAKANPAKARASNIVRLQRRRARIKAAAGNYSPSDIREMLQRQNGRCAACLKDIRKTYSVDHIMPLVRGGSNDPSNLQLLCLSCNVSKGKMHPDDWAKRIGRLFA